MSTQAILPKVALTHPIKIAVEEGKVYNFCTCGLSENQPFCNGSHKGTGFAPIKYLAEKNEIVNFCGCKHSKNGVKCDGSHKSLSV